MTESENFNLRTWLSQKFRWLLLLVIGTIITWFIGRQMDWWSIDWSGTDSYIAVVITNKSDATFTIPEEFRKGFGNELHFKSAKSEQLIRFIKEDDNLSEVQAKIIAEKLIEDEKCVLIIGNSTSSLTEITLNSILSSNYSRPGFLLPIATADNIIEKAKDQEFQGILRMMPNNDEQAKAIRNFIFNKFSKETVNIAILSDEENTTYSHNLSQKIADKIILTKDEDKKGAIVLKKDYGNSNRLINDYKVLSEFNQIPDIIVFVGISSNGSLLMEELSNLKIDIPVIFTDGCTVNNLMKKSEDKPNHYFISAVDINGNSNQSPTYEPVGVDARNLSELIINKIDGNITRESVANYIINLKRENEMIMDDGKAGKYQFNQDGENTAMNWKVYHYMNGELSIVYDGN